MYTIHCKFRAAIGSALAYVVPCSSIERFKRPAYAYASLDGTIEKKNPSDSQFPSTIGAKKTARTETELTSLLILDGFENYRLTLGHEASVRNRTGYKGAGRVIHTSPAYPGERSPVHPS